MNKTSLSEQKFDVVILGGGAAGMMAAISAKRHHPDYSVALIDRTFALGRKLLVCGAGRCNVTNIHLDESIENHYYGANPDFIRSVFQQFPYQAIIDFFNDLGVELYVERKTNIGKLFPVTDQARTITALLEDELLRLGVRIYLNTEVTHIEEKPDGWQLTTKNVGKDGAGLAAQFNSQRLIISAGGQTYPALGSNGSGYSLARSLGHKLIQPVPSALPLEAKSQLSHLLQGTKLEVEVTTIIDEKIIKTRTDDVMFTKYGLSGPAILNVSREVSLHFHRENKNNAYVRLNFLPGKNKITAEKFLNERWEKRPIQTIEKSLYGLYPNKVPGAILQILNIDSQKPVANLSSTDKAIIINSLVDTRIKITGTKGWNEAEFTAGGIEVSDIDADTMASKLHNGLYFAGEILDVDGDVGGFNLSWSWASGFVAGKLQ